MNEHGTTNDDTMTVKMTKKIKKKKLDESERENIYIGIGKKTKYINNDKQKPPLPPIILLFCGSFMHILPRIASPLCRPRFLQH